MRTRKFAVGASVFVHVCVFAFVVYDGSPRDTKQEVLIEFAPMKPTVAPVVDKEIEKTRGVAHVEPADLGQKTQDSEPQPAALRAAALGALFAIDLGSLRSGAMQTGLQTDGPRILAAGFSLVEPTIHLTEGEVDSLVTEGHGSAKQGRKRGVHGDQRGPTVCFPLPQ
jgi:hypothetical protein